MKDKDLFTHNRDKEFTLSERLRPKSIEDFIGQQDIIGNSSLLYKMIKDDNLSSFILWGPPGSGKTSIASIIQHNTKNIWVSFSAVVSGIKEIKEIMEQAENNFILHGKKTILFIDEIHRFNKSQQDAFLPYVEKGTIILIGATTENPSFSIISPLLSRMRVFVLKKLKDSDIELMIERSISFLSENGIKISIDNECKNLIIKISDGDARRCYGLIEMALKFNEDNKKEFNISKEIIERVIQGRLPNYDKKGDYHFDYISALHKSMRNSDPDATIYYTVKMLESGEDPLYILRRIIRFASEDVGLADPNALLISIAAKNAFESLGLPEGNLAIIEAAVYNSLAPKSNSLYIAYEEAKKDILKNPDLEVPLQLRNAPTSLMKELGYGKEYKYAHDYDIPVTDMQCLPDELKDKKYYNPKNFGFEEKLKKRIEKIEEIKKRFKKGENK
ncbi:MAG TPA: replication-associated recombination protein A [Spirochaetota bacterium]|nr:replication-associated recombination protein A [Spirochaetota bacterium]HOL57734.1 replication-associated recombination protein A [Spirochaetota bacterium]HPP05300.1 replication-associated recombination protein A [Spirochaetota bacterium]